MKLLLLIALSGVVTVLQTPLFMAPELSAPITQYVKKGEVVYIHNKHNVDPIPAQTYVQENDDQSILSDKIDNSEFYTTVDQRGMEAFILRKHVKLVYKDTRELNEPINPYKKDPMDYRLEEPIEDTYPLVKKKLRRATLGLTVATSTHAHYTYPSLISDESYGSRYGFLGEIMRKASWDLTNRFFFGFSYHLLMQKNEFTLSNSISSSEYLYEFGVGPLLAYDLFRNEKNRLSIKGRITPLIMKHEIKQSSLTNNATYASFYSINVMPALGMTYERLHWFPDTAFVATLDSCIKIPQTATAHNRKDTPYWNKTDDSFKYALEGELRLTLGISSTY